MSDLPKFVNGAKTVRVNVSMKARDLHEIDMAAWRTGVTRSAYLINAVLEKIEKEKNA